MIRSINTKLFYIFIFLLCFGSFAEHQIKTYRENNNPIVETYYKGVSTANLDKLRNAHEKDVINFVYKYAHQYNLSPNLVSSVIYVESSGISSAKSSVGALGIMQVMPFHFDESQDPYDVEINIQQGTKLLSELTSEYGEYDGLRAYNCGEHGAIRDTSCGAAYARRILRMAGR